VITNYEEYFNDPVRKLKTQMMQNQWDLDHRLSVMGMKRAWQESMADNVDSTHPLVLYLYIPTETKLVKRAFLRLRLEKFRSYGTGAATASEEILIGDYQRVMPIEYVDTTEPGGYHSHTASASIIGDHTHGGVSTPDGGHSHGITVDEDTGHGHQLPNHVHFVTISGHTHDITHGIYEGTSASDVTVTINGTDRTAALGGPFNANQSGLDITQYMTATGWNTISLGSGTLGRIHATVFVEIYLP
jgi:hypothetical protein